MLQIENLAYRYARATRPHLVVPTFSLEKGRHALLLGPSGSGKSTLLHLLAAILPPQDGMLRVGDTDLATLKGGAADRWRGRTIGFLPQKLALLPSLTARENILLSAFANDAREDHARADQLLTALGLHDQAIKKPHQLSQGQRQRVALARALFNRPLFLLADEPTASLDDAACHAALALLREHADNNGASLIVSTHDARVLQAMPDAQILRLSAPVAGED
ncbi:ATP-binding cassette domain-containing protein [uncultured Oxalicibacterium sp.]|uniref:ABC transporter ATP-binding protein n=1 Tax=uncultured Oxalicibacterium sp. TaxID=1168540 RepID=UPI0025E67B5F|nr:ATP-binding cassette domain-containing protein [uncultured Oxalicibacterium sp.]